LARFRISHECAFVRMCLINCPRLLRGQRVLYMGTVVNAVSEW